MKLDEYARKSNVWLWGKVFILKSDKFGKHTFLVSQFPGKTFEERQKFIDINSCVSPAIYYSSVQNDEVLSVFDSLDLYNTMEGDSE